MKETLRWVGLTVALVALCVWAQASGPVTQYQTNNSTTNRTTSAWGTIITSLSRDVNYVDVYNSSTSGTLILGLGAYGAEYNAIYIPPNTARVYPLIIPKGKRVSLKSLNATVSTGELILNFLE